MQFTYLITKYSAFEISALIFSPVVGHMLEKVGRKTSIIFGFTVLVLASLLIAFTAFIENDIAYLLLAMLARVVQGIGDMWVQTSCKINTALLPNTF